MLGGVLLPAGVPGTASAPSAATLPAAAIFGIAGATEGEEILRIPLSEPEGLGAPAAFLEATLYRPAGAGPFPLAVLATAPARARPPRRTLLRAAEPLVPRPGFVVLVPMRRGYGGSDGEG
jgi:hypothetical protein